MHKIEYILNCISNESKDDKKIQQQEKKLFKLEILLSGFYSRTRTLLGPVFIYFIFITYNQLANKLFFTGTSLEKKVDIAQFSSNQKKSGKEVALIF